MNAKRLFVKSAFALAPLALAALAQPALAVTNLNKCQTIAVPGSYKLVADVKAAPGQDCFVIDTFHVTLDLNGHTVTTDFATGTGIRDSGRIEFFDITVRNGTVGSWGNRGVDLSSTRNALVENISATSNGSEGIAVKTGIVRNNTLLSNGAGIRAFSNTLVSGNRVETTHGSFAPGIFAGAGSTVQNNTVSDTTGSGIDAVNGTVSGNTVFGGKALGIRVTCPALVTANTATANASGNFLQTGVCTVSNNALS